MLETVNTAMDHNEGAGGRDPETSALQTHASQHLEPKDEKMVEEPAKLNTETEQPPTESPLQPTQTEAAQNIIAADGPVNSADQ